MLSLAVMLFQLSMERVKDCMVKRRMCVLRLKKYLQRSMYPRVLGVEEKKVIEKIVIIMYDMSSSVTDIDSVRLDMYACNQRSYDAIPPTSAALEYHAKHATYQSGWLHLKPSNNSPNGKTESI